MIFRKPKYFSFILRKLQDVPPDIAMCMLYIDNALSMRALQEMMSADNEHVSIILFSILQLFVRHQLAVLEVTKPFCTATLSS